MIETVGWHVIFSVQTKENFFFDHSFPSWCPQCYLLENIDFAKKIILR